MHLKISSQIFKQVICNHLLFKTTWIMFVQLNIYLVKILDLEINVQRGSFVRRTIPWSTFLSCKALNNSFLTLDYSVLLLLQQGSAKKEYCMILCDEECYKKMLSSKFMLMDFK